MNPQECLKTLEEYISVTPQRVSIAKAFILQNFDSDTNKLVQSVLKANEASVPDKIVIYLSDDDMEEMIKNAAEGLSWMLTGCEAIWGLISVGLLIPASSELIYHPIQPLRWVKGGNSDSWDIKHLSLPIPQTVLLSRLITNREHQSLSDVNSGKDGRFIPEKMAAFSYLRLSLALVSRQKLVFITQPDYSWCFPPRQKGPQALLCAP